MVAVVGQIVQALTLLGVLVALVMIAISVYQLWALLKSLNLGPEGVRLLRAHVTLKAWVAFFLTYVFFGTAVGGTPVEVRRIINLLLLVALIAQVSYAVLTFRRWRKIRGEDRFAARSALGAGEILTSVAIPVERVTVQEAVDIVEEQQAEAVQRLKEAAQREGGIPDD